MVIFFFDTYSLKVSIIFIKSTFITFVVEDANNIDKDKSNLNDELSDISDEDFSDVNGTNALRIKRVRRIPEIQSCVNAISVILLYVFYRFPGINCKK